jgi:uncharacterized membrane protein YfhO
MERDGQASENGQMAETPHDKHPKGTVTHILRKLIPEWESFRILMPFLAFLIPTLIMLTLFIVNEIFPFGDRSFLFSDMYHQYMPFFSEFMHKIKAGEGLDYSYNVGIGSNFLALYVYYLASPLHWLAFLFPEKYLMEFMSYMAMVKIGLCGLTSCIYLRRHFKTKDLSILFFSTFYALSGFMAAYNWNIMWLDSVVLLPLVVLGLERLVKKQKGGLYGFTLALSIFTNYYISIMVCIFLVFYFIVLFCSEPFREKGARLWALIRFAYYSILAAWIAGCLLIPEVCAIAETEFGSSSFPEKLESYFSVLDVLARHCMCISTERGLDHWPNIYCGVAVFLLIPLYVLNRKIPLRRRFFHMALLGIFLVSFATNMADFLWHGFNYPDSLPARQSFIYIFLVLIMGYEALRNVAYLEKRQILYGYLGAVLFLLFSEKFSESDHFQEAVQLLNLAFLTIYAVLIYMYRTRAIAHQTYAPNRLTEDGYASGTTTSLSHISTDLQQSSGEIAVSDLTGSVYGSIQRQNVQERIYHDETIQRVSGAKINKNERIKWARCLGVAALVAVIAESAVNTYDTSVGTTSRSSYLGQQADYLTLLAQVEEERGDDFYRIEKFDRKTKNDGTLTGYATASVFSSTLNSRVKDFYEKVGMRHSKVYYGFDGATPLISAMLNVDYMFGDIDTQANNLFVLSGQSGDITLFTNTATLPFGYVAPIDYDISEAYPDEPVNLQNQMIASLGIGGQLLSQVEIEDAGDNVRLAAPEGGHYYMLLTASGTGDVKTTVRNRTLEFNDLKKGSLLYLGYLEAGDIALLENDDDDDTTPELRMEAYLMDDLVLEEALETLSARHLENVTYDTTHVSGDITLNEPGRLILSIPDEDGWEIQIDGVDTTPERFGGAFIAFDLEPGYHTLTMHYQPEGKWIGIIMSITGILLFATTLLWEKKQRT